ncbi:MAG: hypothetical protein K9W44_10355 [Candidatus Lokiarchaeota archaeon]|nr:hypothetical protein [Candidatus Harpocratesius repetitus]
MFLSFLLLVWILFIEIILIIAIQMHFRQTNFFPSLIKSIFLILFFLNDLFYLITFFIPSSRPEIALILMESRVICWFVSMPLFVFFIETLQQEKLTGNFFFISIYSAFLLGNCIHSPWIIEYSLNYGWILKFTSIMSIFIGIFLGSIVGILIYRYTQSFNKNTLTKEKNYQKYILMGFIIAFLREAFVKIFHFMYLREVFLIIGFSITTFLYLRYPKSIFINSIKVFQFLIIDAESGMVLFKLGKDVQLLEPSFHASTIIQQKIACTQSKIKQLYFGDRIFLLDYKSVQNRSICAILLVNKMFFGIEKIIKNILAQFIKNFNQALKEKLDDLSIYATFTSKIDFLFNLLPFEKAF